MTPPLTPKMVAPPDDSPIRLSRPPSGSEAKSIPAFLMSQASSRVVMMASMSRRPLAASSGRKPSYFLAIQGMMETV